MQEIAIQNEDSSTKGRKRPKAVDESGKKRFLIVSKIPISGALFVLYFSVLFFSFLGEDVLAFFAGLIPPDLKKSHINPLWPKERAPVE